MVIIRIFRDSLPLLLMKKKAAVITKPSPQKRSTILTFLTIVLMIQRIVISIRITNRA